MNADEQDKLSSGTLSAIRKELPPHQRNNITVIKTTITNKPGTAQVGAISKAQKIEGGAFWRQQKIALKSRTVPKKFERGTLHCHPVL